jgi:hypothetical protein
MYGELDINFYTSLTLVTDGGKGGLDALAALSPEGYSYVHVC